MTAYSNLSKEQLIAEIKRLKKGKKFGLLWEHKPEDVAELCKAKLPVLVDAEDKEISGDSKSPINILIEGDNYHALSVLNYTHKGRIDIIYIDPPYNTGAKDWKYNNAYVDSNDSYRHSKWLSFMEKRIRLSKNLLRPSGVFICTIDENEHASLGLLLQEIFFDREIVCVTIIHNPGGIQGKNFSYCHEYAYFVYPKKGTYISKVERNDIDPTPLRDWGKESSKRGAAKTCFYPIYVKNGDVIKFGEICPDKFHPKKANILRKDGIVEIYPVDKNGVERKWRFSRKSIEGIKEEILCQKIKDELVILRAKKNYRWKTVWIDGKYNANIYGTQLLNSIIKTTFPFPKSLHAVADCIKAVIHDKEDAVVLDFFAGSGTTAHAVLELNKNDQGNRQFILCTNNENKIAEQVCYPRIKKVITGYKDAKGEKIKGLGGNLKYFRTDFVDADPTDKNKKKLTEMATEMLCLKESTFEKVTKKKDFKIYKNTNHYTGIIFDQMAIPDFKKAIAKIKGRFSVYVFSLGDDSFEDEFCDVKQKVKLSPIPEVILRVYRRIFK